MLKKLNELRNKYPIQSLFYEVASDLLLVSENDDDLETYIIEIITYGLNTGIVGTLIYYNDINEFFKRHCIELMEYESVIEEITYLDLEINICNIVWYAYQSIVREIAWHLDIEY